MSFSGADAPSPEPVAVNVSLKKICKTVVESEFASSVIYQEQDSKGKKDGLMISFYKEAGDVAEIAHYKDGQLHGLRLYFLEGSALFAREVYVHGVLIESWFKE